MPGKLMKIGSFSDWEGLFKEWREEIGVNNDAIRNFKFDTLYGAIETEEISFGYYKGRNKWENVRQIPTQNMRDALMNLIVYQGDTEFASVEQQRYLFETAPSDYDRSSLTRVMIEEMRHGWQMCALLIDHFGATGKSEEHTSELQSPCNLVCRLLLEKKNSSLKAARDARGSRPARTRSVCG